jgi:hypothetical protein
MSLNISPFAALLTCWLIAAAAQAGSPPTVTVAIDAGADAPALRRLIARTFGMAVSVVPSSGSARYRLRLRRAGKQKMSLSIHEGQVQLIGRDLSLATGERPALRLACLLLERAIALKLPSFRRLPPGPSVHAKAESRLAGSGSRATTTRPVSPTSTPATTKRHEPATQRSPIPIGGKNKEKVSGSESKAKPTEPAPSRPPAKAPAPQRRFGVLAGVGGGLWLDPLQARLGPVLGVRYSLLAWLAVGGSASVLGLAALDARGLDVSANDISVSVDGEVALLRGGPLSLLATLQLGVNIQYLSVRAVLYAGPPAEEQFALIQALVGGQLVGSWALASWIALRVSAGVQARLNAQKIVLPEPYRNQGDALSDRNVAPFFFAGLEVRPF